MDTKLIGAVALVLGFAACKGSAGPNGAQGIAGAAGSQGVAGPKGEAGPQGPAGPAGAQGPKGDQGTQGVQGAPGAVVPHAAWVDASGSEVRVADFQGASIFIDGAGFVWNVDLYTGALTPRRTLSAFEYASADCTGPALAGANTPREVTAQPDGLFYARSDTQVTQQVAVHSMNTGPNTACGSASGMRNALELAGMQQVQQPAAPVGPLHIEIR